jgi:hypothetical protein
VREDLAVDRPGARIEERHGIAAGRILR